MTAPTVAPATETRPVDAFLAALARANPFSHHRVTATGAQPVDVQTIHEAEFRHLVALAERARDQNEAVGAVVWGESGSGKSNLLRRLGEWAADARVPSGRAVLVNFLELQAAPDRLHRAVLNAVTCALTNGLTSPWHRTPLYALLEGLIRPALPAGKKSLPPAELDAVFRRQMAAPAAVVGAIPAVRQAVELLLAFFKSALTERTRKGDGTTAAAAVRRLSGDGLDEDEAKAVGLRPADTANPLDAADSAAILAVLAQVVRGGEKPLVLCFDQINNLPRQQIADVSRLLHDLNDRLRNVALVLSEVRTELVKLTDAGVVSQATWERLSANKVEVQRVPVAQGRHILEARLEQFLTPFEGAEDVKRHYTEDALFPLGEVWFAKRFGESVDVRPRKVIDLARDRWEELQKSLDAAPDKRKWLDQWPKTGPIDPPPVVPLEKLIDERVGKELEGRIAKHTATPKELPPNADNLCGLTEALLATGGVGLAVECPGNGSPYDLIARGPGPDGRGELITGLVFVTSGNATSVAAALRGPVEDKKRPGRVLLVTDVRVPLALGKQATAKGRTYFAELKKLPGFEHIALPAAEYAALEALDTVARQAGDLEIHPHDGPARPLKRDEVFASYRRNARLKNHPLLGRFVGVAPAPGAPALADADVRAFIVGRLALTLGDDTQGLARQFLNQLSSERRAGLDLAACRAKIEAAAKVMAEAGDITANKLPDGLFLLPMRKPAAR